MSKLTPSQLNIGAQTAYNFADEATSSTTYVAPTTPQSVTVTVGSSGNVLVTFSAGLYNVAALKRLSVAVSGANTVAANDSWSIRNDSATFIGVQSMTHLFTGLTPGSTTFSLQHNTASGSGHIFERRITAVTL